MASIVSSVISAERSELIVSTIRCAVTWMVSCRAAIDSSTVPTLYCWLVDNWAPVSS